MSGNTTSTEQNYRYILSLFGELERQLSQIQFNVSSQIQSNVSSQIQSNVSSQIQSNVSSQIQSIASSQIQSNVSWLTNYNNRKVLSVYF